MTLICNCLALLNNGIIFIILFILLLLLEKKKQLYLSLIFEKNDQTRLVWCNIQEATLLSCDKKTTKQEMIPQRRLFYIGFV